MKHVRSHTIITIFSFVTFLALCGSNAAFASGKLYYGSRLGMTVTVLSVSDLDTEHATIRTKHTRDDAIGYCREYVLKISAKCISDELAIPMNDQITGNCATGEFSDFFGTKYQFLGIRKPNEDNLAKYAIKNLATGEVADGSSASGYPTNLNLFKALCPAKGLLDE